MIWTSRPGIILNVIKKLIGITGVSIQMQQSCVNERDYGYRKRERMEMEQNEPNLSEK